MRGELVRLERNVDSFLNVQAAGSGNKIIMKTERVDHYYRVDGEANMDVILECSDVSFIYYGDGNFEIKYAPVGGEEICIISGGLSEKQIRRLDSAAYGQYFLGINLKGGAVYVLGQSTSDPDDFEGWVGNIYDSLLEQV